jgi:hypothetical protein
MQLGLAARAGLVIDVDDDLNPRQMRPVGSLGCSGQRLASLGVALEIVVFLMRPCGCATQAYVRSG